jgi:hypothetical protein
MIGHLLAYLYIAAFWFLLLSFFILPLAFSYWRHREKAEQSATEAALKRCKADTTNDHIWDA